MFNKIESFFDGLFNSVEPIPVGTYVYQSDSDRELPYKLHLRVETNGTGIEAKLSKLKSLVEKGLISPEDAAAKRKEILDSM